MGYAIGILFLENVAGLIAGIIFGLLAYFFKYIHGKPYCNPLKAAYSLAFALAITFASEFSTFTNAKFIGSLTFGYVCFRVWGLNKPVKEMSAVWFWIQPFLFGTVGA